MSVFTTIGHALVGAGKLVAKGWQLLQEAGLDDDVLRLALPLVKRANEKYIDNPSRREWVVEGLVAHKVPEGVARIALELALSLWRKELANLGK